MGRPTARTVALRDRIVAALRAEWPLPVSTRRVCELLGAHRYDETGYRIYPQLCALDRMGVIERIRRDADCRDVFWRFLGDPSDADLNAAVEAVESPASGAARREVPPHQLPQRNQPDQCLSGGAGPQLNLPTLDSFIRALDKAERRFGNAAASGDQDKEQVAAGALAALVRRFVDACATS